jgi:pSer/pThr/pTyr-binding forkhead associated (FHA) protein
MDADELRDGDRLIEIDDPTAADNVPDDAVLRLAMHPKGGMIKIRKPEVAIGRQATADVRLYLPDISRQHCRVVLVKGQWEILDLESTNGIYVNGERVPCATLRTGDLIQIGSYFFQVLIGNDSLATPPPAKDDDVPWPWRKAS